MRGHAASMTVLRPKSADEALALYQKHPEALALAGGTDLMVAWNEGHLNGRTILDLSRVSNWTRVRSTPRSLRIGALASHTAIQQNEHVRKHFPLLAAACRTVGGIQIQNRGTLGGNIANASPAGDTFPALAVYEARVHTASVRGTRALPFLDIFTGVKQTALEPSELIVSVELPWPKPRPGRQQFRKVGTRAAQAISKTVFAGALWLRRDGSIRQARLALGSMAPTVRRLPQAEAYLAEKKPTPRHLQEACRLLEDDVSPIDDVRSTREYRLEVSKNLLKSFLTG